MINPSTVIEPQSISFYQFPWLLLHGMKQAANSQVIFSRSGVNKVPLSNLRLSLGGDKKAHQSSWLLAETNSSRRHVVVLQSCALNFYIIFIKQPWFLSFFLWHIKKAAACWCVWWVNLSLTAMTLQEFGVPFMETSARSGLNVELAFTAVAKWVSFSLNTFIKQTGLYCH